MSDSGSPFWPSEQALAFGERYADVLLKWAALFQAASELVAANVALGRAAADSAAEFDQWVRRSTQAPWAWARPDAFAQFMEMFRPPST